ncbi:peptidyl-prolyl cis-trans isomerase chloroplastic [Micractinium conductrix]|uniref:Peptidyl-prolyl cis-trans isomerase chloroplastic n=1 Tax=Micractinium conductrix TaxID=554055 RepID=A0A2P6VR14_9CHLO|nr:peptidyl-prolyl cis-trans isomerase chloroplastic [Micractinium conductrix]|eukprot:PSC76546.1 peptidyl-prolyl cis-trans isomerase chloroplastic [Micractinium conductrix]
MEAPCCSTRALGALARARPCGSSRRRSVRQIRCLAAPQHGQQQQQQTGGPSQLPPSRRRALGLVLAAAPALLAAAPPPAAAEPAADLLESSSSSSSGADVDTTVTDRIYLDVGLCPEAVRTDRRLGDKTPFCQQPDAVGRIVINLYGHAAPGSVATIVAAAKAGAYANTSLSKILPGRYIVAGAQGPKRSGLVQAPEGLPPNPDLLKSASFRLSHRRPGTVSLNLSESEDEDFLRFGKGYRNLGLLITTGPGPVPSLDGENIVVGQVAEGLDVVAAITQVPTFTPNDNGRAFNQFANFIGDDRAAKTASKWGRPLQAVVITGCGVL